MRPPVSLAVPALSLALLAACSGPPKHPDPFWPPGANCGDVAYFYASEGTLVDDASEHCGGVLGTFYTDYADNSAIGDSLFFDAWHRNNAVYFHSPIFTFEFDVSELVEGNEIEATSGGSAFWIDDALEIRDFAPVTRGWARVEKTETDGTFDEPYWLLEWDVTWGDPDGAGPWYTATGYDWVWFTPG